MIDSHDLRKLTSHQLLRKYSQVLDELLYRGVIRTRNAPLGDFTEKLVCKALGLTQEQSSKAGFDAVDDASGLRYQIKSRKLNPPNKSRQLSALRNLKTRPFDVLAGVLFDERSNIHKAALIPITLVIDHSIPQSHTNSHQFFLRDEVWNWAGVTDITELLQQTLTRI